MGVQWVSIAAVLSVASAQISRTPVVVGQTFLAGSTDPTQGSTAWALTSHGIAEKLFTVDRTGSIVGQAGESVRRLDTFSWEATLRSGRRFSDGTALTASHVVDAFTQLNQVNSGAQASLGAINVTRVDDLTVRIQSERATPVMDAVLAEWPFVVYRVSNGQRLFTGPFAVETFVVNERFELIPNPHYPGPGGRPLITVRKYSSGQALSAALQAGQVDLAFHLPVSELTTLRAQTNITVRSFEVGYHYMMWHNTRSTSALSDVRVRRAVDTAIDRVALSQELRGGRGTRSLFPDYTPYFQADANAHGDRSAAEALLDQAGWIKNASGTRLKDGAPLTLRVVAYPQRPGLVIMLPVIKQQLTALGIVVNETVTSGDSWAQLDQIMADKTFDLLLWAQNTLPAGDPQWFLNAFFRSDGGSNHAGLNSYEIDRLLDGFGQAEARAQRVSETAAVHTQILAEVPVSNLVTPEWHVGLSSSSRLSTYTPWGSDYYVIRADFACTTACGTTTMTTTTTTTNNVEVASSAIRVIVGGLSAATVLLHVLLP
mmetsp:Transcript_84426/g.239346  ORF Transcript_84426/g.239346 Transcript_84426/m.239346 type:complete len:543 (-) Transcript_84426:538-2166(-)